MADPNTILSLYGLHRGQIFAGLLPCNQFLYVVHHPRSECPLVGHGFFAHTLLPSLSDDLVVETAIRQAALTRRSPGDLENTAIKRVLRQYCISTSYSLPWAVFRAEYAASPAEHVRIAVVRAASVGTALLANEILSLVNDSYDSSSANQEVLVVGHIPTSAIIADIALPELLRALPSWIVADQPCGSIHQPARNDDPNEIPPFPSFALEWARRAATVPKGNAACMATHTAKVLLTSTRGPYPSRVDFASNQIHSDVPELAADLLIWSERPTRPLCPSEAVQWIPRRRAAEQLIAATINR
jgi:hypothetical protein